MPIYHVVNPQTGQKISLQGSIPPSEQELDQIFSQSSGGQPQSSPGGGGIVDAVGNIVGGAANFMAPATTNFVTKYNPVAQIPEMQRLHEMGKTNPQGAVQQAMTDVQKVKDAERAAKGEAAGYVVGGAGVGQGLGMAAGFGGVGRAMQKSSAEGLTLPERATKGALGFGEGALEAGALQTLLHPIQTAGDIGGAVQKINPFSKEKAAQKVTDIVGQSGQDLDQKVFDRIENEIPDKLGSPTNKSAVKKLVKKAVATMKGAARGEDTGASLMDALDFRRAISRTAYDTKGGIQEQVDREIARILTEEIHSQLPATIPPDRIYNIVSSIQKNIPTLIKAVGVSGLAALIGIEGARVIAK